MHINTGGPPSPHPWPQWKLSRRIGQPVGWVAMLFLLLTLSACGGKAPPPHANVVPPPPLTASQSTLGLDVMQAAWGEGVFWTPDPANLPTEQASEREDKDALRLQARPPASELEGVGDGPRKRSNFFLAQRAYPLDTLPAGGFADAVMETQAMQSLQAAAALPRWENIGPAPMRNSRIGQQENDVSGRVISLAIDPRDSNVVYLGAAQGGVWKTTNSGQSWTPLSDDQPSLVIGALALDPQNPDIVYAGTGEPSTGGDNYYGAGILKSTDGGQSWILLGGDVFRGMGVSRIEVHPQNSNVIYAASTLSGVLGPANPPRGLFMSTDGGQTWQAQLTCNECPGVSDLVMDPANPSTLYVGLPSLGVAKSVDGGANWQFLSNGLPDPQQVSVGQVVMDISRSNPNVVYASFHLRIPNQYDGAIVFRTTDGGQSWGQVSTDNYNFCASQCWYSHELTVDPTNPNKFYLGGAADYTGDSPDNFSIRRVVVGTTDGGQTWTDLSPGDAPNRVLHPDMQVLVVDPSNPNILWAGNDGGIWRSTNGGASWENKNTNLATLQFTGFAVNPFDDRIIQGGMQDNNKAYTTDGGASLAWTAVDVGDGGFALIDPFAPNIWYGTRFNISFQRNDQGSSFTEWWPMKLQGVDIQDRSLFYIPIAADPSTQGTLYLGTYRVYRTRDRGEQWTAISGDLSKGQGYVSTIAVAPGDPQTIYVGASDGAIQVTRNDGGRWTNVTQAPLPNRFVSEIAVSSLDPDVAYAVFNGFDSHTPGQPGHVFKTENGGASWRDISANLPDTPALSIVLDDRRPGVLYIGTDAGVFQSADDGRNWQPYNNGMPNVAVVDLAISQRSQTLYAATHGRSVFKLDFSGEPLPPTLTPTPIPPGQRHDVLLPVVSNGGGQGGPTPTPTRTPTPIGPPTATTTPASTNTPTPTATPVTPEGTPLPTTEPTATPTIPPTPQPTNTPGSGPTPTATQTPDVGKFRDDFSNPGSGWPTGSAGTCVSNYADVNGDSQSDLYTAQVLAFNDICIYSAPANAQKNGSYAVTALKDTATDGSVYGLVFGLNDPNIGANSRFYVFWIDSTGQQYALQKFDQGTWTNLTSGNGGPFVPHPAVLPGVNANRLKVRRDGSEILLFVNGRFLEAFDDSSFPNNGYTGVAVWYAINGPTAIAGFDDFEVNRVATVYEDDYSQGSSGWFTGVDAICQASYAGNEYRTATQPDNLCFYSSPSGGQRNGRFEATARRDESLYPTAYGLLLGADETFSNLYIFVVAPDSQEFALLQYIDGAGWFGVTWDPTLNTPWLYSDKINAGSGTNHLVAERDGDLFRLWVNGQFLGGYIDAAPLESAYFGVVNWSSQFDTAIATFDDYGVTAWDGGGGSVAGAAGAKERIGSRPGALRDEEVREQK